MPLRKTKKQADIIITLQICQEYLYIYFSKQLSQMKSIKDMLKIT